MNSTLAAVGLPVALATIMFGLGLSLTPRDFGTVLRSPKAVIVALLCQIVLLPAACFGIVLTFDLPGELALGVMLLVASPGGTMANLFSHLYGGRVALNVTLTAINSVLAVVTLPFVVNRSATYFLGADAGIGLQFDKVVQVFAIVLVPVAVGMLARARFPGPAKSLERPVKLLSVAMLAVVIAGAIIAERENLVIYLLAVGLIVLIINLLSLAVGYAAPRLFGVDHRSATATGFEVGIHNSALAITIAIDVFDSTTVAIPAAVYSIVMYFTAGLFGYAASLGRRNPTEEPVRPPVHDAA